MTVTSTQAIQVCQQSVTVYAQVKLSLQVTRAVANEARDQRHGLSPSQKKQQEDTELIIHTRW